MDEKQFAINCQRSFLFFVENALKAKPTYQQKEFIKAVQKASDRTASRFISVRSGHGIGKTTLLAWLSLWFGLTKKDAKIPALAPVQAQITKQLMPELRKWHSQMFPPFRQAIDVLSQDMKFKNGNSFYAKVANADNPESVAGVHATNLLFVIDEASGVPDIIFEVLQGALTEENFIFVMTGNPTRVNGYFYNSHHKLKDQFQTLHFSSLDSQNVTNDSFAKMIEADYGIDSDVYRVRVLGEFPTQNSSALFPLKLIDEAMKRDGYADSSGVRTLGVDVAGFGDDATCLAIRTGMKFQPLQLFRNLDTQQVAALAGTVASESRCSAIFVDGIGIGSGVYDTLKRNRGAGRVINAHAGKQSTKPDTYFNMRAEMYHRLKQWIEDGGSLPYDEKLREELLAIDYIYTTSGKMQLIAKKLIKELIGRSPDRADAVAFNFYEEIRSNNKFAQFARECETIGDWDEY